MMEFRDPVNNQHDKEEQDKAQRKTSCAKMSLVFFYIIPTITILLATTAFVFLTVYLPRHQQQRTLVDEFENVTTTTIIQINSTVAPTSISSSKANRIRTLYTVMPKLSECGHKTMSSMSRRRRKRIIGGEKVEDWRLYPWIGQIAANVTNIGEVYHCTGTLITKRYFLTSAHCVHNIPPTHVKLRSDTKPFQVEEVIVQWYKILLERYREKNLPKHFKPRVYDIALLRLDRDAHYPVCLPLKKLYDLNENDFKTVEGQVAGYGVISNNETKSSNEFLHLVSLSRVENNKCQMYYTSPDDFINDDKVKDKLLCAGGDFKDFCRGDSGAPFFISVHENTTEEKIFQLGIATFGGEICGLKPGVFTSTINYVEFILNTVRD